MPTTNRHLGNTVWAMRKRGATELALAAMKYSWNKRKRERDALFSELLHAAHMAQLAQDAKHDKSFGRTIGELDWVAEIARLREELTCRKQS